MAAGLAIGSAFVRLPYYALGAGSVRPTGELISVDGGGLYPPTAGVAFPTVSVSGRVTVWGLLAAWFDDETDVVKEEVVLQGRTPAQSQEYNYRQMDDAKTVAMKVALAELGQAEGTGAQVIELVPDSPAAAVLRPGDVVIEVAGTPVSSSTELVNQITSRLPGDAVELRVARLVEGAVDREVTETVTATLAESEEKPGSAFFGVRVQTYFEVTFPHEVIIDSGQVGGPSAGLAFTLGVLDSLTPGELTGGEPVAATGTMGPDGTVGAIGGLPHKVDAVRRTDADLFLVPDTQSPAELDEARRRAGDDLEIVTVHDLDEAVAAILAHGGQAPGPLASASS
ncbi:MAG: PDZ domain-containing protein [Acidimicrobiia bacterium]|nr:PDZ domain-containing protein [Acidimicrobiia bacterium]